MTDIAELFKPTEAAIVSGVELSAVNHAIDREWLPSRVVRRGKSRGVSAEACIYIAFYHASADYLTPKERRFAIDVVSRRAEEAVESSLWKIFYEVRHEFLSIDLNPFMKKTHERLDRYLAARAMVTSSPDVLGGIPVIKGTRIPVYDVAASVAADIPVSRILEAYPALTEYKIELASLYAKANPPQGRPTERPMLDEVKRVSTRLVARRRAKA